MVAASVPPTVLPANDTSVPAKPTTGSLNTTLKRIGDALVGSAWPEAWLIVTVGTMLSNVTVLSTLVDAWLGLFAASIAAPAGMLTTILPGAVIPLIETPYVVPLPVTVATSVPGAVLSVRATSAPVNPVTG